MRECPACALESDTDEETCPYCGYEFPEVKKTIHWFAILFAILMLWPLFWVVDHFLN